MKTKFKYISLAAALLVIATGCNKKLDQVNPVQQTSSSYWKTGDDALKGINAAYSSLIVDGTYMRFTPILLDVRGDDVRSNSPWTAISNVGRFGLGTADPAGYGRIVRKDGKVACIVEQKDASETQRAITEINTGIIVAPTAKLAQWLGRLSNKNAQNEYYLTDTIAMAVAAGNEVTTAHPEHAWEVLGVNSKLQLAELERIYQRNYALALAGTGTHVMDPARLDVRGELRCGRDVVIDVNCVFEGQVVLGDRVEISANCVLKSVTVAAGTKILPFTHIEDASVGADCRIGPFARIRPGTTLATDTHIGNFVEIKNSQIDSGSKINHLSYIGDATIGQHVNIGAGAITCNYDGANKHRTVIEDHVFIGSNTELVAPVTVGKGATIGAGTTLTRHAPPGKLTVSRVKQLTIDGWQRPIKQK